VFSTTSAQPISPKLLKGLGCFPTRFCKRSARLKFCKTHEWVPLCIACQNGKLRCGYSPDLLAILQGNLGRTTPVFASVANLLCEKADDVYGGRLPVHVRCLIDECANIGQIPNLEKLMATIRSREISACLVLQAQSQLKALYKDNADTIIGNCDSSIFLGGKEPGTLKELNQALGKETIDTFNTGESRGREVSHSLNYQKLGKDLMSVDELAVMDGGKCLLQIRGVRPFLSRKYDITKHPNYKYLSDFDEKNAFDIEKYLSTRLPVRPRELYPNYEITPEELAAQTSA